MAIMLTSPTNESTTDDSSYWTIMLEQMIETPCRRS